ncbi:hypothetical protein B0H16DRAFT_1470823 [Mycena metata]|uniref:Uncharacterized protein n=1 Tax=Mycena metata TaxID=1033252 RepID=A0AAD7HT92_9AGAR|nr:hypothetical protein B0H16DRAFT_1470823 [Mycena metata]
MPLVNTIKPTRNALPAKGLLNKSRDKRHAILIRGSGKRLSHRNGVDHRGNPLVLYSVTLLTFVVLDIKQNINVYYAQNIFPQMLPRVKEEWSGTLSGSLKFAPSNSTLTANKLDSDA